MTLNSLGLPKSPQQTKVCVAMSGGVDSSAAAAMLKKEGYDVFGITMDLLTPPYRPEHSSVADAAKVADKLGIPHCFLDLREKFAREVVDYFADSYLHGLTPSPCIMCNRHIKLGALADKARSLGADIIVTGHYADIRLTSHGVELHRAEDLRRDQSYFLFGISQFAKDRLIFPLGDKMKESVKKEAFEVMPWFGELEEYKDSQEICFVEKDYIHTLKNELNIEQKGAIRNLQGEQIGTHKGYMQYTIGKRKGLDIPLSLKAQYVVKIDALRNEIIVGDKDDLLKREIVAKSLTPRDLQGLKDGEYHIKIRFRSKAVRANLAFNGDEIRAKLLEPVYGVAEGQGLVIYKDVVVLGGGFIESSM